VLVEDVCVVVESPLGLGPPQLARVSLASPSTAAGRAGHGLRSHTRAVRELAAAFRLALSHPAARERDQRPGDCRLAGRDPST